MKEVAGRRIFAGNVVTGTKARTSATGGVVWLQLCPELGLTEQALYLAKKLISMA